jgi:hypothetical protein
LRRASQEPEEKSALPLGAIYVRHGSKTEPASPEDIERLATRANVSEAIGLDLGVQLDTSKVRTIDAELLSDEFRDQRLEIWRREMLGKLPEPDPARFASVLTLKPIGEHRSPEEYRDEVELHVQAIKGTPGIWMRIIAAELVERESSKLGVTVLNKSVENYENTVIELLFIGLTRGKHTPDLSRCSEEARSSRGAGRMGRESHGAYGPGNIADTHSTAEGRTT